MDFEPIGHVVFNENHSDGRSNSQNVFSEVLSYLPGDLLTDITILLQDTGYVTIRPIKLARADWYRFDRSVKKMGGIWVRGSGFSHWSIPMTRLNYSKG